MPRLTRKTVLLTLALLLVLAGVSYAAFTLVHTVAGSPTATTVLTLTNLANNTRSSPGTTFNNLIGGGGGVGYQRALLECNLTYAGNPTTTGSLDIVLKKTVDGTNFEDSATGRLPDATCAPTGGQVGTRVTYEIRLPPYNFQAVALNNATGQQINSGTVKILPFTSTGTP